MTRRLHYWRERLRRARLHRPALLTRIAFRVLDVLADLAIRLTEGSNPR